MAKAYTTRVGSGPYPTELFGDHAEEIRAKGGEYGTTTGRPRRCGWLDMVALNYALEVTLLNLLLPSPPGSSHNHMQGDTQSSNTFLCNLHPPLALPAATGNEGVAIWADPPKLLTGPVGGQGLQ